MYGVDPAEVTPMLCVLLAPHILHLWAAEAAFKQMFLPENN